jgi:hypothetical protein
MHKSGRSACTYVMIGKLPTEDKIASIRCMNFRSRQNLLQFVEGCILLTSPSLHTPSERCGHYRSVVRCFEFHYWVREVAQFLHCGDEKLL